MNDNQRAYTSMTEKVNIMLTDHAVELAATAANVATLQTDLETKILETLDNDGIATADNTGTAEEKETKRTTLIVNSRTAVPFLVEFAIAAGDTNLRRKIDFTASAWDSFDDNKVYVEAKVVHDFATTNSVALALLGYTGGMLTAFDGALTAFFPMISKSREKVGESSEYTTKVAKNIIELHAIIDLIDIQMNKLEFTSDTLFGIYYNVRSIDDAGGGSGNVFTGSVNPGETKLVCNFIYDPSITFKIENTGTVILNFTLTQDGIAVGTTIPVAPGDVVNKSITEFFTSGNGLTVINSAVTVGTYKVTKM